MDPFGYTPEKTFIIFSCKGNASSAEESGTGFFLPVKDAGGGKPKQSFSIFSYSSQFLKTPPSEILPW